MTELINELINDEAVYRTALPTPGLLNVCIYLYLSIEIFGQKTYICFW